MGKYELKMMYSEYYDSGMPLLSSSSIYYVVLKSGQEIFRGADKLDAIFFMQSMILSKLDA